MRKENQKELEFLEDLSNKFMKIDSRIGDLSELPTADKTSIVNSIKQITAGQYQEPQVDPDPIITHFKSLLI